MHWCLITKGDEYRLGRLTSTHQRNEVRHGWRIVARWPLEPTNQKVTETIWIDIWSLA
jgi:hypothetical protein